MSCMRAEKNLRKSSGSSCSEKGQKSRPRKRICKRICKLSAHRRQHDERLHQNTLAGVKGHAHHDVRCRCF